MTKAGEFQQKAEVHMEALKALIDTMPQKGDKEDQCQKVVLLNRFNNLDRAIYSVTDDDLKIE